MELRKERPIRREPVEIVELVRRDPTQLGMLDCGQLTGSDACGPHPQDPVCTDRQVVAESVDQLHRDAELLAALADERVPVGLTGVDLAPRQLPEAGQRRWLTALRDQHLAGAIDQRSPDDNLLGHGGHHRAVPGPELLSADVVARELQSLDGWSGDASGITRDVECATFPAAIELVRQVADVAEEMNHHPDIDIRWRTVTFAVSTHSAGGVTSYDIDLAKRINALAG
jgi:4a-hydroxytetrahydrobiopterin dehydratase